MRNRDWRLSAKRHTQTQTHRVKQLYVSITEQTSCFCYFPSERIRCHKQTAEICRQKKHIDDAEKNIYNFIHGIQTQVTLTIMF